MFICGSFVCVCAWCSASNSNNSPIIGALVCVCAKLDTIRDSVAPRSGELVVVPDGANTLRERATFAKAESAVTVKVNGDAARGTVTPIVALDAAVPDAMSPIRPIRPTTLSTGLLVLDSDTEEATTEKDSPSSLTLVPVDEEIADSN